MDLFRIFCKNEIVMLLKVCGINQVDNYSRVRSIGVDWIGINFYAPSKRYIGTTDLPPKENGGRIGVYVKADIDTILETAQTYQLDYAQLHGDESVEFCKEVSAHLPVIKVFRVGGDVDWTDVAQYEDVCEYFLFDTKTIEWGGSGHHFDWSVLEGYKGHTPFLISGGIGPHDIKRVRGLSHPQFVGVDINSRFEDEPGIKNIDLVRTFAKQLNQKNTILTT